jgi:hypothetical protein
VQEIDERAFDAIMDTNVKSIHFLSNFAREAMLKHGDGRRDHQRELGRWLPRERRDRRLLGLERPP